MHYISDLMHFVMFDLNMLNDYLQICIYFVRNSAIPQFSQRIIEFGAYDYYSSLF